MVGTTYRHRLVSLSLPWFVSVSSACAMKLFCVLCFCRRVFALLQVRGVSSVRSLSVIQLNSEEPFVASLTLVIAADDNSTAGGGGGSSGGGVPHREASAPIAGGVGRHPQPREVLDSAKAVLARHNIGRSTVELEVLEDESRSSVERVVSGGGAGGGLGSQGCRGGVAGSHAQGHSHAHGHGHGHDVVVPEHGGGCRGKQEEIALNSTAVDLV